MNWIRCLLLVSTACWVYAARGACALPTKVIHFVHLCTLLPASLPFLNKSFRPTYFFAAAKKSRQKNARGQCSSSNCQANFAGRLRMLPASGNRLQQTQLASMLIALLNSQNNRRALSRGEGKSIGFAD